MADGSIAAPSLTLNDVVMTSMILLKIIKNVFANVFVLSDTSLFNYFFLLIIFFFSLTTCIQNDEYIILCKFGGRIMSDF